MKCMQKVSVLVFSDFFASVQTWKFDFMRRDKNLFKTSVNRLFPG